MAQPNVPANSRSKSRSKFLLRARSSPPLSRAREERVFSVTISTSPRLGVFRDIDFGHRSVALLESQAIFRGAPIYAYCLMPNHAHILIGVGPRSPLPRFVERWKERCAREWWRLRRQESFWQRGFDDQGPHGPEEVRATALHILGNPVRAGLVEDRRDYPLAGSFVWKV